MTTRALAHSVQIGVVLTLEFISISDTGPCLVTLPLANLTPLVFYALALVGWLQQQHANVSGWLTDLGTAASFTLIVFTIGLKSILWAGGVRVPYGRRSAL